MRKLSKKNVVELTKKIATMLGVRRKLRKVRFTECKVGYCYMDAGEITYPEWIMWTNDPYIINFVIHEVLHLKYPKAQHEDYEYRNMEIRLNKRFGIQLIFKGAYAKFMYNKVGDVLYKHSWAIKLQKTFGKPNFKQKRKEIAESLEDEYVDYDVNWRTVTGNFCW